MQTVDVPKELTGSSGRHYRAKSLLQYRPDVGRVWLATSGEENFVLKDVHEKMLADFKRDIQPRLDQNPFIRLPCDEIPKWDVLVYEWLTDDFLKLIRKDIPSQARRTVLKAALRGIAELHSKDIVHLDIKPDNIMVDCEGNGQEAVIKRVQITDLENAAYLPRTRCIKGALLGNDYWRSPEGILKGELQKPADIFSFGAVCIYAMLRRIIFEPDNEFKEQEKQGAVPEIIRLQRQISFFGDQEGFDGLMQVLADDEIAMAVLPDLWHDRAAKYHSYTPIGTWEGMEDDQFKDVVLKMMSLDPRKRITAKQALDHPWFKGHDLE